MWISSIVSKILLTYAFYYATIANMNQGVIPSLFSLSSVYIMVTFYFRFGERVSKMAFLGMVIMCLCVFCLAFVPKNENTAELTTIPGLSARKALYISIVLGALAPACYAIKGFYFRLAQQDFDYPAMDLAIDGMLV